MALLFALLTHGVTITPIAIMIICKKNSGKIKDLTIEMLEHRNLGADHV
jgi:hypothetical protein